MPSRYVDAFLNKGILRIGSAHGYRAIEDPEIGDIGEATLQRHGALPNVNIVTEDSSPISVVTGPPGETPLVQIDGASGSVVIENNTFVNHYDYGDAYLFCFTDAEPTPDFLRKIGYDAAIEISDIKEFSRLIAERLKNIGLAPGRVFTRKCLYNGRVVNDQSQINKDWRSPDNPYFRKEPRYSYKEEMRMVFPAFS